LQLTGDNTVTVDNNTSITHNLFGGILLEGNSNDITISGNISYNGREKFYNTSSYTWGRDKDGIGIGGIGGDITGITITGATISYNGPEDGDQVAGDDNETGAGIYIGTSYAMTVSNLSITKNNIYKNHTNGIFIDHDLISGTISYNIIRDNLNYTSTDTRNAFHVNCTNAGFTSVNIWNNIIARNYGNAGLYLTGTNETISLKNNIFYNNGRTGTYRGDLWLQDADITGLTETNNVFYRAGTAWDSASVIEHNTTTWDRTHIVGASAGYWQNDSGKGANDSVANPLFTSSSDYRLLSSSPAINAGVDVGLVSDFLPGHGINGLPDIGAYEYNSIPILTSPAQAATGLAFPIVFKWVAYSGAYKYWLRVDDNSNFSSPEISNQEVIPATYCSATECTYSADASTLKMGTHYYWNVRALHP
jgi:hypothetical protein